MFSVLPAYAELHCVSNFSFLRGASHPEELVARAAALGYAALALTDECSLAGVVRAHVAARAHGLKLLIGAEFRLEAHARLVLLATDRASYGNLAELITGARRRCEKGRYRLEWDDLAAAQGCLALYVPPADGVVAEAHAQLAQARRLGERFAGRAWLAVELLCGPDDRGRLAALRALAAAAGLPPVAAGDVHMHVRSRRPLQDVLTALRLGTPVAAAAHALFPNAERHLRMRMRLAQLYPPELLAATLDVAARCDFSLDSLRYEYPAELVPPGRTPAAHLAALTAEGLARRYPQGAPAPVCAQVKSELALIAELGYEPYFLSVHDIVAFARSRGILCQGRGSAANSAVCYCLGITEVDPARMSVLFERFISRERDEPPDIDVDFEHERREEVIQYLYRKYGRDRAALAATVITYRTKSALRDTARALGFDATRLARIAGAFAWWDRGSDAQARLAEAGLDPAAPRARQLIELARTLAVFPRHLSQHSGGFVLARGLLSRLVPIENAAMPGRSVIQWDKNDLDALGLLKVDVLALGMLTAIRRALALVSQRRGTPFTLSDVPAEDPAVYRMISAADTVGVFQIESRAQMSMLPRLQPRAFYDLVIEVAIVRPGPIQGGMVHPYLRRRQGLEPVRYPSEAVKSVLARTLGVPIFQEQVMQLAVVAAGFTPGEADGLRRAMAAWRRKGGLGHLERRLIDGMLARGYPREFADQIYRQILGFGEYGFPESHAASFALLVYVSAWLKCREPAAFLAALLDSQPMGFYAPSQLVQDARRHGVEVRAVDVTRSAWDCTLERSEAGAARRAGAGAGIRGPAPAAAAVAGAAPCPTSGAAVPAAAAAPAVRLGLRMIGGLAEAAAARIVAARSLAPFADVDDLAQRARLNRHDLKALAAAGALAALAGHRRRAHWQAAGVERALPLALAVREAAPALAPPAEGEDLVADYASLGLTLGRHPLALLRARLARLRCVTAAELQAAPHGRRVRAAGIVTGRQRPETASGVVFVTLEDETGSVNVVVWRDLAVRQRRELLGARLLGVDGVLERDGAVVHLVAGRLSDHSELLGRLATASRDFH